MQRISTAASLAIALVDSVTQWDGVVSVEDL